MDKKECEYVSSAKSSHLGLLSILPALIVFVPERVMKIWPEVFLLLVYVKESQIDPKGDVVITKSFWMRS